MMRGRGRRPGFSTPVTSPKAADPETNPWWWHPSRPGVPSGPQWFSRELDQVDPDLAVTHNRLTGRYQLFTKAPKLANKVCWGWQLLFSFHPAEIGAPVLARLFEASARKWGSARDYFLAIEREMAREQAAIERQSAQDALDMAMPSFEHSRIQVAMRGASNGSKFADYHA